MNKNILSNSETSELMLIGKHQPVFAGNLCSKLDAKGLMDKGLAMRYEGQYVLTERGKTMAKVLNIK